MYVSMTHSSSWKGGANPIHTIAGHIRPLTNNDSGNMFGAVPRRPRPLKHYRRGRNIFGSTTLDSTIPSQIAFNMGRYVNGGIDMSIGKRGNDSLGTLLQPAGSVTTSSDKCDKTGNEYISDIYPHETFLTDNPNDTTTSPQFCCNPERKALNRARYATTLLSKKYYTRHAEYVKSRCQSYDQNAFHYETTTLGNFVGGCYPNTACSNKRVIYKPNNQQFATRGAVDCSTRLLKQKVDTLSSFSHPNQNVYTDGQSMVTNRCDKSVYKTSCKSIF